MIADKGMSLASRLAHRQTTASSRITHLEAFFAWARSHVKKLYVDTSEVQAKPAFLYTDLWQYSEDLVGKAQLSSSQSLANYTGGVADALTLAGLVYKPNRWEDDLSTSITAIFHSDHSRQVQSLIG